MLRQLLGDDALGVLGRPVALGEVGFHHVLQVVDVVEVHVVEIVDRGFQVARHRDVDEEASASSGGAAWPCSTSRASRRVRAPRSS